MRSTIEDAVCPYINLLDCESDLLGQPLLLYSLGLGILSETALQEVGLLRCQTRPTRRVHFFWILLSRRRAGHVGPVGGHSLNTLVLPVVGLLFLLLKRIRLQLEAVLLDRVSALVERIMLIEAEGQLVLDTLDICHQIELAIGN